MTGRQFIGIDEVAERYGVSVRVIHGRTSAAAIPHLKRNGLRRLLFRADWLDSWDDGASLEVVEYPDGSRAVRPAAVARRDAA